ncbi:hypothetical protein [Streptomyces sp. NPDC006335]|uniref:hypothetical protein n=1 Tax=Streptomyces sp. NPDC006335 TaxID=3156895 RepID=UPI0033AB4133
MDVRIWHRLRPVQNAPIGQVELERCGEGHGCGCGRGPLAYGNDGTAHADAAMLTAVRLDSSGATLSLGRAV